MKSSRRLRRLTRAGSGNALQFVGRSKFCRCSLQAPGCRVVRSVWRYERPSNTAPRCPAPARHGERSGHVALASWSKLVGTRWPAHQGKTARWQRSGVRRERDTFNAAARVQATIKGATLTARSVTAWQRLAARRGFWDMDGSDHGRKSGAFITASDGSKTCMPPRLHQSARCCRCCGTPVPTSPAGLDLGVAMVVTGCGKGGAVPDPTWLNSPFASTRLRARSMRGRSFDSGMPYSLKAVAANTDVAIVKNP